MLVPPWAGSSQPVGAIKAASLGEEPYNKLALTLNSHLAAARLESSSASAPSQGAFKSSEEKKNLTFIKCDFFFFAVLLSHVNHLRDSEEQQRI